MKLISEYHENDIQCIVEKKEDGEKKYTIEGVFAQADQKKTVMDVSTLNQLWKGQ